MYVYTYVYNVLCSCILELQRANNSYEEKLKSGCAAENTMFSLSWDIEELKYLNDECRKMYSEIVECTNACTSEMFQQRNIPQRLTQIRKKLCDLRKRITHFKRIPATHIFVLMISSDTRDKKPYALPVQWFPYAGLKETDIRRLISNLCSKMVSLGMKISGTLQIFIRWCPIYITGFSSDGEFNYLRTKGYTRPLSVLQIRSDVRNKYSKFSLRKLLAMLTPKC